MAEHRPFHCFLSLREDYKGSEADHLTVTWKPPLLIFTCAACEKIDPENLNPEDKFIENRSSRYINLYDLYLLASQGMDEL